MKRAKIIIGVIVLVVFVAGAAFMAARLWAADGADGLSGGGLMLSLVDKAVGGPQMFNLEIKPAPELPNRPAEVTGVFVRREDDNIFVGTGEIGPGPSDRKAKNDDQLPGTGHRGGRKPGHSDLSGHNAAFLRVWGSAKGRS